MRSVQDRPKAVAPVEIAFCCTNIDMHSLEEFRELERLGVPVHVEHCLGLCHYCSQGRMAVADGEIVVADSSSAFWLALESLDAPYESDAGLDDALDSAASAPQSPG